MTPVFPHLSDRLRALLAALAMLPAVLSAATQIHVSPTGNNANPGTIAQPVATPQGAQLRVRALIDAGLSDPVEVIFAAGTYAMDASLELRPQDSGTAAFPITWKAADGAEVILDGGKPITSPWTDGGSGIWFTDLSGTGLADGQWNFRQLFVDGSRATRARFPNVSEANPFLYATGGGFDHAIIDPALIKESWGSAADAQINIVPQSRFFNQWNTVTGVNPNSGRIDLADSERHRLIDRGSWFWIEGVQEELDEPGEWFLDSTTGRLYYMPQPGVDPNTLTFTAPFLNRIVNAMGDVNEGTHVAHVHFDGLKFLHTTFSLGHIEARVHSDTAIMFENTKDSSVRNCHFENIGGYALWLHLDSQRNAFDHNTVLHSGGGGVLLTGSRFAYMDDSKIYTPGEAAAKVAPILNEITRNTVEHCGKIRYYGGGVHLDSRPFSMTMAPGNYIAHNLFNDLSRNGIFAFRNQGGNVVEYNHIHNAMQTTIDGAAIHFATMNTLNAPNFILNNWLYDIFGFNQNASGVPNRTLANGVFLDWDTSNTTVRDNWIYNTVGGAVKVIFGGNQNVFQSNNPSSITVITPPFVAEVGPDGTATNGIDLETNKLTGSIVSYQDTPYFSKTGTWTEETAVGIVNLFEFKFLTATAAAPSEATFTLPIPKDGTYQISLLYYRGTNRASNVPITIDHADGIADLTWNMKQGSRFGFAVPLGAYRFVASETNTVTLDTTGTDGKVVADSVAYVKIEENDPPVAANVRIEGSAAIGSTLTGSFTYSDANNDLQGASQFRWYRSDDDVLENGDLEISQATSQSYIVQPDDMGKYLFVEVTPVAVSGITSGAAVPSAASAQVAPNDPPTASSVAVSGSAEVGTQLTASYTYFDADSDPEGTSILKWYRSDDTLLDEGDTVVAGAVMVSPTAVKTSASFTNQRLAGNLFNANGMSPSEEQLLDLDGSQPGEPTSADGVSWVTFSGSEASLLADRKVWFVVDLGARFALDQMQVWNFQWNHNRGDLSNRGISQFDCYVRDSAADTADGTPGGTAINVDLSATTFDLGSSDPWQAALVDQPLARAPNADNYSGQSFSLSGQAGRFLAIVADSYFGGNGIGLGKVRLQAGQGTLNYTPVAADSGKYLIFTVTPVATSGIPIGAAVADASGLVGGGGNAAPVASNIAITGTATVGETLQGSYDYFDAEGDAESGTGLRWLRSDDGTLDEDDTPVGDALSYLVTSGDVGKTLFLEVTPKATSGMPTGSATVSAGVLVPNLPPTGRHLLIEENFSDSDAPLHGSSADTFADAITVAGGSSTWVAAGSFLQNGAVNGGNTAAHLNLGSYLNEAKGTADGKFELSLSISENAGYWISLGFAAENTPDTLKNFTNTGTGTGTTSGLATIIYRAQDSTSTPGELDLFGYRNQNAIDGPDGNTGNRTLSVTLDLTPAGGYDGSSNYGTASWSDSVLGPLGTFTYTTSRDFGSILISSANTTGMIGALSLDQIPGGNRYADWLAANAPATGFTTDSDFDGIPNGVEHVLGTNPNVPNTGLTDVSGTTSSITYRHKLNPNISSDINYAYQWSSDLDEWKAGGETDSGGTRATILPSLPDDNDIVTVVITITDGPSARLFGRLQANQGP